MPKSTRPRMRHASTTGTHAAELFVIDTLRLQSGQVLRNAPIAYHTYGQLADTADNVIVVCHPITSNSNPREWFGRLVGMGRPIDTSKYFVICMNALGSPYGSASPLTFVDGNARRGSYGTLFPRTTIRDDLNAHKCVLDSLGVRQIAAVVGASMGGMLAVEYGFLGSDYVRCVVTIASQAAQSRWAAAFGEVHRACIRADPDFLEGKYSQQRRPVRGLATARMAQMVACRTAMSYERKFDRHFVPSMSRRDSGIDMDKSDTDDEKCSDEEATSGPGPVASYLQYQGDKFSNHFDANCFIALLDKLDAHDVSRGRAGSVEDALSSVEPPVLVVSIDTDLLMPPAEQARMAKAIPRAYLRTITSDEGHDALFLGQDQISEHIIEFFDLHLSTHRW